MKKAAITTLKISIFFLAWATLSGVLEIPGEDPAVWRFFAELIPFLLIIFFTFSFCRIDKGKVKIPLMKNAGKGAMAGMLIGLLWIGMSIAISLFFNQLFFTGRNDVESLWLWIISAFINVIMQELLIRGYIYQLLKAEYKLSAAVLITTAIFTFLHGGAFEAGVIAVINVITMYLFTTALYETEGTILAPVMAHAVWNIIGAVVFGAVRLADDFPSLYSTAASDNIVLSGGAYKIEGSVVVSIVNIVLLILFSFRYRTGYKRTKIH